MPGDTCDVEHRIAVKTQTQEEERHRESERASHALPHCCFPSLIFLFSFLTISPSCIVSRESRSQARRMFRMKNCSFVVVRENGKVERGERTRPETMNAPQEREPIRPYFLVCVCLSCSELFFKQIFSLVRIFRSVKSHSGISWTRAHLYLQLLHTLS